MIQFGNRNPWEDGFDLTIVFSTLDIIMSACGESLYHLGRTLPEKGRISDK